MNSDLSNLDCNMTNIIENYKNNDDSLLLNNNIKEKLLSDIE